MRDVVACHHERWDGQGYPRSLVGPSIPLAARIFSIVDASDAMTHDFPTGEAMSSKGSLAEIERCSGTQFDPCVVSDFLSMVTVAGLPLRDGRPHLRVAG